MFPKESRLPRAIFQGKPRRRVRFKYGNISFFDAPTLQTAVVVSKKVARRAVDRNKIRRRSLAALRHYPPHKLGVVFYPTKEVLKAEFADLREELVNTSGAR